jgi:3-oxoacyl-[acyl-carrier protein] reductase
MSSPDPARLAFPGLVGATIAITGGARGIGWAAALLAERAGANVVVGDLSDESLAEVADVAGSRGLNIRGFKLDVAVDEDSRAFIQDAASDGQRLGLVCSAGIAPDVDVLEMTAEQWQVVQDVNLRGTFTAAQEAARVMRDRGTGGPVVTISSAVGTTGSPGLTHYAATKGGVIAMTRSMAREVGKYGVRVNCVSPGGGLNTPLYLNRATPEQVAARIAGLPMRRLGEPEDCANFIVFLLSDLSSWITGQNFNINGGSIMP